MQNQSQFVVLGKLDKAGIACSGACAIHCLLLPVIAFASPMISSLLHNEWIHIALLLTLFPIAMISFSKSYKVHKNIKASVFGGCGVVLLLLAFALEGHQISEVMTAIGSVSLIIGHALNMTYLRKI